MLPKIYEPYQRKSIRYTLAFAAIGIIIAAYMYYMPQYELERHTADPYPYYRLVAEEAKAQMVDEFLIAAIIHNESKFRPHATSRRGAKGLMQLMPETADWIAYRLGDESYNEEKLTDPALNIKYGTWLIAHLLAVFEQNEVLALAAYNAGSSVVADWMEDNGWDENFSDIASIPYSETRHYVKNVLHDRSIYRHLYGPKEK